MIQLYHPFHLKCFDKIKNFTKQYMDNFITDALYVKNIPIPKNLVQEINEELKNYNLPEADNFLCFKRKDYLISNYEGLHIDYSSVFREPIHASLVLPIDGCSSTYMYWFNGEFTIEPTVVPDTYITYGKIIWKKTPSFYKKVEISEYPMLTRVDIPHSAKSNIDGSYRTILSIRFKQNLTFEEIVSKITI